MGKSNATGCEVSTEALSLEDAMKGKSGVCDSCEELCYIVLGFAVSNEE